MEQDQEWKQQEWYERFVVLSDKIYAKTIGHASWFTADSTFWIYQEPIELDDIDE